MIFLTIFVARPWIFTVGAIDFLWYFGNVMWWKVSPGTVDTFYQPPRDILCGLVAIVTTMIAIVAVLFLFEEHVPKHMRRLCGILFLSLATGLAIGLIHSSIWIYRQYSLTDVTLDLLASALIALGVTGAMATIFLSFLPSRAARQKTTESIESFS